MSEPTFSILIPTKGGGDLPWVAHTIATQKLIPGDEILIIGDGREEGMVEVQQMIDALGPPFRYVQGPHTNDWGHSQLNLGLEIAKGSHILCQDDDDGYLPRAFETVRSILSENPTVPHIFRFIANTGLVWWDLAREGQVMSGGIGGHNLVVPNIPGKKGEKGWTPEYRGDFQWILKVLDAYRRPERIWRREILTRQRPNKTILDWPIASGDTDRLERLRIIRNECAPFMTHHQTPISPEQQLAFGSALDDDRWAYLYTHREDKHDVGFSYTVRIDGKLWVTYGLATAYRGQGLGRLVVQHALDAAMTDVYAESLASNSPILYLQKSLGFIETRRFDGPYGPTVELFRQYQ